MTLCACGTPRGCRQPDHRAISLRAVAQRRLVRRVHAMLALVDAGVRRDESPELARLDDLVGQAATLRDRL